LPVERDGGKLVVNWHNGWKVEYKITKQAVPEQLHVTGGHAFKKNKYERHRTERPLIHVSLHDQ
jgi:hypothetical protein